MEFETCFPCPIKLSCQTTGLFRQGYCDNGLSTSQKIAKEFCAARFKKCYKILQTFRRIGYGQPEGL